MKEPELIIKDISHYFTISKAVAKASGIDKLSQDNMIRLVEIVQREAGK